LKKQTNLNGFYMKTGKWRDHFVHIGDIFACIPTKFDLTAVVQYNLRNYCRFPDRHDFGAKDKEVAADG